MASRIVWDAFREDRGSLLVLHNCDNPRCIKPEHLFVGTHSDNMKDMYAKGRGKPPKKVPFKEDAKIKSLVVSGWRKSEVAKRYKVTPTYIAYILGDRRK